MRISDWSSDVCSSDLAGVSLEEALDTTYTDTRKGALKDDLSRALTNVKTGKPWADGFRTVHPTNKAALSMATDKERLEIGRASCRERVCEYVSISVVAVSLKKKI